MTLAIFQEVFDIFLAGMKGIGLRVMNGHIPFAFDVRWYLLSSEKEVCVGDTQKFVVISNRALTNICILCKIVMDYMREAIPTLW